MITSLISKPIWYKVEEVRQFIIPLFGINISFYVSEEKKNYATTYHLKMINHDPNQIFMMQ